MHTLQSVIFKAVNPNEVGFLEPILTQQYRGEVSVPVAEYMGVVLQPSIGKLHMDRLSGMPVTVIDFVQNGQAVKLISDDQRLIFKSLKDAGLGNGFLHQQILEKGKVIGAFDATDEVIAAGTFGGMPSLPSMDAAVHGDINLMRGQELVTDNSMKYIYNELSVINGTLDSQETDKPTATILFKNALSKANEALTPLKGDGLQILLRRMSTLQSLILFEFNKNPQVFLGMVQEFIATVQAQNAQSTMKTHSMNTTADKLLADRSILAKCVMEEAEQQRQLIFQKVPTQKQVNIIDEAFILELINSLQNPQNTSMNTDLVNTQALFTNSIQAGAKMVSALNKTAKTSLNVGHGRLEELLPEAFNPLANDESIVSSKIFNWITAKTGMDTSQFQFMYAAENAPNFINGGNNDTIFGLPGTVPQTMEQLLFPNRDGSVTPGAAPVMTADPLSAALSKLAQSVGVQQNPVAPAMPQAAPQQFSFPAPQPPQPLQNVVNTQLGQPTAALPQITFQPQVTAQPQPNLINQYNQTMNQQLQAAPPVQAQGGNNMFIGQQYGMVAPQAQPQGTDIMISADPTQVYVAYPTRLVNIPNVGQAVEVYTKTGMLAAYALTNGQIMSLQGQIVGTAQVYQAPVAQPQFNQFAAQPQLGLMNQQPQFIGMMTQQPQQFNAYAPATVAPQFSGFSQAQPMFQGQDSLRQNPLFGQPQKTISLI